MDDRLPDGAGYRGWADLVAQRLAIEHRAASDGHSADHQPTAGREPAPGEHAGFRYANLAIRGRLFDNIVDEQVPAALEMRADLISFAAGGNDVLRRNFDGPVLMSRFDRVVAQLRATGADVIIFRFADVTRRLPGRRVILPRVAVLNEAVGEVAQRHGAYLIDLWHDDEFHNPLLWSEDRLHMSTAGHRRTAAHVLTALGVAPDPQWLDSPPAPQRSWAQARFADARWVGQHLAPWLKRRLTGRSSGDLITAKRPTLTPLGEQT